MAGDGPAAGTTYSRLIAFVFVFNLIVGTGALTMPKAFQQAGWLIGIGVVLLLAVASYITSTFIVEAMSIANGVSRLRCSGTDSIEPEFDQSMASDDSFSNPLISIQSKERDPLLGNALAYSTEQTPFNITKKFELSEMAAMFFPPWGLVLFYLSMCIYLYGDLAVYAAAVPKSLRDVICTYVINSTNDQGIVDVINQTLQESDICWNTSHLTRMQVYWMCLSGFFVLLGPFAFFTVSKTKFLQLFTVVFRWSAFICMFVLTMYVFVHRGSGDSALPLPQPSLFTLKNIPALFGICIYAFMCHHSLPSLITPIHNKRGIQWLLLGDYTLILIFYLLLSISAVFSFTTIQDLFTLNFQPNDHNDDAKLLPDVSVLRYYLALFPVVTLSTNFPIIAITLRENLKTLVHNVQLLRRPQNALSQQRPSHSFLVERIAFPLLAIVPSVLIAFGTNDVSSLVNYTGTYAGACIQYVIPACLVFSARRHWTGKFPYSPMSQFGLIQSPFQHIAWILSTLLWTVMAMILVTLYIFSNAKH